jgi:hypothetical protein
VQKTVTETNHYAEQFKNSRGNIFSKWLMVSDWEPITAAEIYVVLAFFMLMGIVQRSVSNRISHKSTCSHTSVWLYHVVGQI